jgi:hypothetical protein
MLGKIETLVEAADELEKIALVSAKQKGQPRVLSPIPAGLGLSPLAPLLVERRIM